MGKNIKAIIWDLDGVILESEKYHIEAEMDTLKGYGINIEKALAMKYFGIRSREYFKELGKHFQIKLPLKKIINSHQKKLIKYYKDIIPLTTHVPETLKILKNKYLLGVGTSTRRELVMITLEKYNLIRYFDEIVTAEDVKKGKPNPDIFLKTAEKLKVTPNECVVIEDAQAGFKAGKKAGMYVIGRLAEHNKNQDFSEADYLINDIKEIPNIIKKLNLN